ncbi:MAG: four helix bundle protein [Ignavibacteriales bacterium]|nr:MAG: four helix bundle protein [Ignavibacteriales bacterium]
MNLEELQVYQKAMDIGEQIWKIVIQWDYFSKDTVGKQLVKAIDSVAANLSEGFGRYFYKEEKQFCYYSRGSLFESKTWITKAHNRNLIEDVIFENMVKEINRIGVKLNNYINSIGKKKDKQYNDSEANDDGAE